MPNAKYINRLWRYRKARHLSQKQVAFLMRHKKPTQISLWENGEELPTLENALRLAYILDAPVEQLFPDLAGEAKRQVDQRSTDRPDLQKCLHH